MQLRDWILLCVASGFAIVTTVMTGVISHKTGFNQGFESGRAHQAQLTFDVDIDVPSFNPECIKAIESSSWRVTVEGVETTVKVNPVKVKIRDSTQTTKPGR